MIQPDIRIHQEYAIRLWIAEMVAGGCHRFHAPSEGALRKRVRPRLQRGDRLFRRAVATAVGDHDHLDMHIARRRQLPNQPLRKQ